MEMSQSFKPYYSEKDNGDNNEDQVVEGLTQIEQDETPTKSNGKTVKTKNKNFMASQVDIISSKSVAQDSSIIQEMEDEDCSIASTSVALKSPNSQKNRPCERWGHTMTDVGSGMVLVYGGQQFNSKGNFQTLKDLHVYDL